MAQIKAATATSLEEQRVMSLQRLTAIAILALIVFTANIQAQTPTASAVSSVTGTVTSEGTVRMIAHGESLQVRMEIYSAAGELVSDSGFRQGSIVDWKQTDATQPLIDGSYLVVVTVRDFKGNLNQQMAALSLQAGSFVWGDGSATASANTFKAIANNEFAARASGGFRFRTNLAGTTGCNLPAGSGVFNCTSSRATKENFLFVNGGDVLSRLRDIDVSTWNYTSEGRTVRHMGPMAEDFYRAFQLGTGNTSIGVQDLTGVSLAAIKELHQRTDQLQQKTVEVEQLRDQVNQLRLENSEMERRLATLEQLMLGQAQQQQTPKLH
jgi:cell division protein FtsB